MVEEHTQRTTRRDAVIVDALLAIFDLLKDVDRTAGSRELLVQARAFDQAVKNWMTVPPTETQIAAMFDLVLDLHGKAVALAGESHSRLE